MHLKGLYVRGNGTLLLSALSKDLFFIMSIGGLEILRDCNISARMSEVKSEKFPEFPIGLSGEFPECSKFLLT